MHEHTTLADGVAEQVQEPPTALTPVRKPRRNRKSARDAGAKLERIVAEYLAETLDDDRIERRTRNGAKDRGDVSGVRTIRGARVVIEAKSYSSDRI